MEPTHQHGGKTSESILDKAVILVALSIQPGQHILDAGCGYGYMTKEFAKRVGTTGKVYAADLYEPAILQLKNEPLPPAITLILTDISKSIDIPPASLDLVYLSMVFHGFTPPQSKGFLQEVKRLLKPGGTLAIVEIDKKDSSFGPPMHIRCPPEALCQIVPLTPSRLTPIGHTIYMQTFINAS